MQNYSQINKKWWNKAAPIHAGSKLYSLNSFKQGKSSLQSIETEELADVKGKTLLHLMCHFGMDSLSWARKGAVVTGVDIADDAITLAKQLSQETHIPADFIASDVCDLPTILHKKFDIVYMSYGVLLWLSDIQLFAKIVNNFLKPGGIFYIVELHPFTNMLNEKGTLSLDYFDKGPYMDDSEGTYADWHAPIKGATYIWLYTMSDLINALTSAGLTIQFLHEFQYAYYDQFPGLMRKNKKGQFVFKESRSQIPLLFSLKATK